MMMTGSFIDYKFYLHVTFNNIRDVGGFFIKPLVFSILFFIVGISIVYGLVRSVIPGRYIAAKWLLCLASILILNVPGGILDNLISIYKIHNQEKQALGTVLEDQGWTWFVPKEKTEGVAGKNIVLIALESVEASFLQGKFSALTPNLNALAKDMNYYPMEQVEGSDFTIGALYTYLTGWPCFYKNDGNEIFGQAERLNISSITNLLHKLGYQQTYMMGNPSFAGMDNMLEMFDFDVKCEDDYDPSLRVKNWGLHDYDLFELAKQEVLQLKSTATPFTFAMSTISTHHPNGVFDVRMAQKFDTQESDLELMVKAVDDHIGSFIQFLKENDLYENTAIFIMPDHTLMGNYARVLNDFSNDRDLFLMTNADLSLQRDTRITQLDVARLIMEGSEVEHNMRFLTNHLEGNKSDYISKHKDIFVRLNEAALIPADSVKVSTTAMQAKKVASIRKPDAKTVYLKSCAKSQEGENPDSKIYLGLDTIVAQRGVNLILYQKASSDYTVENFDTYESIDQVRLLYTRMEECIRSKQYFAVLVHDSAGDRFRKWREDFAGLGFVKLSAIQNRQSYLAISRYGYVSEVLAGKKVEKVLSYMPPSPRRTKDEILRDGRDPSKWIAHAGGGYDGKTYTNCKEAMDLSYKKGYRLLELDIIKTADEHYVAAHDWDKWKSHVAYTGDLPPPRDTFMKYKLHGKYTPMDMEAINAWFADHPGTIFISDKVNDPERFVPTFLDKSRLMMELFSFEAIELAQKMGIKAPIMSDNLLDYLGNDRIAALEKRGVDHLAVSMHTISENPETYLKYKEAGIKVYAFHLNQSRFKDEGFVARHLLDYCYGSYADYWDLR